MTILMKNVILFSIVGTLITVFVKIRDNLINQKLWVAIALVGYFICTSGVVYTMINPVPMFRFEPDRYGRYHVVEYFMTNMRGQYGGEGYIMSSLALLISGSILFLIKVDAFFEKKLSKRIAIGVGVLSVFFFLQIYLMCYRIKTPWYQTNFWPPSNFLRGPIGRDQGNNI